MQGSWRAVAFYPPTWVAMAAALLAVAVILTVLEPSPALSVVVIIVGILAVIAWPVTLSATGTLAEISAPREEPSTVSETDVRALADRLDRLDGRRPSGQLRDIRKSYDRVEFLLDRRRSAGDSAYEQYRADVERVYWAVLARLETVLAGATNGDSHAVAGNEPATATSIQPAGGPEEGPEAASADDPLAQNDVAIAAMERASRELGRVQVGQSTRRATDSLEAIRTLAESPGER